MGTENQMGVSKRELLHRRDKFQLFLAPPKRFAKASLICIQPFLLFCLFFGGRPAFAQSGQKYSTGLNILTATDGLGSSNYEGLNFFTNNNKRGYFTKDGEFALLTRGYFLSNVYCDSLLTTWKISTQEIQTVTAIITGNAQINGTLTIGGILTIDGTNSRISSTSGSIDFDANNLTTTGNISAGNIAAQTATVTDSLTANHVTSNHLTSNNVTTNNVAANNVTSNFVTTNRLTANQATTGQVTSNFLSSDTITANQLTTNKLTLNSFAGTHDGLLKYNTSGLINRLDFSTDTNSVLTGGGAFKNLGSLVAPYTGWHWYGNYLVSDAEYVIVNNNLAVAGKINVGYGTKIISNGSTIDTMRTTRKLDVISDAGKIGLRADTVTISGLQVTGDANKVTLDAQQADTISIPSPVVIGKDTSKYTPPFIGDVALKVAGSATVKGDVAVKGKISAGYLSVSSNTSLNNATITGNLALPSVSTSGRVLLTADSAGNVTGLPDTIISALISNYSGWQWYNSNVLLSTAPVVAIQNNLAVGGKVSIGSLRMSNGSATDTLTTDRRFALEAEKIFLKADTVVIKERLAVKRAYSPTGTMELKADTVTISGLQVTENSNNVSLVPKLADTVSIGATVQIGRIDSSKIFPPTAGKVALEVAGDLRSSGAMVSKRFMFDDQYGITFDANLGQGPTAPPIIHIGKPIYAPIPVPPCTTITSTTYSMNGRIQSVAQNGQYVSALTFESVGWGGHGLIEVEGTNDQGEADNALWINYFCGRNTLINTNTGLPNRGGTIYMGEKVSMLKSAQIGWSDSPYDDNTALNIYPQNDPVGNGIKFNLWNGSIPVISVNNVLMPGASPFTVYGDGRVGIGTGIVNFPTGYLLAVKGKIIAEDIKLKLYDDGWPDYVYAPGYKRPSWLERKKEHEKNGCMLYMESAPDVKENGLTLSRNLIGLTRNMEEAWQEIIVLHEENESLKEEIMQLKKKIENIEKNK